MSEAKNIEVLMAEKDISALGRIQQEGAYKEHGGVRQDI
jgi:hypothetical protein